MRLLRPKAVKRQRMNRGRQEEKGERINAKEVAEGRFPGETQITK